MDDATNSARHESSWIPKHGKEKNSLGLIFTIITLVFWFGYLLLVGFNPSMFV